LTKKDYAVIFAQMAVEQEATSSIEQRRHSLIDLVRGRIVNHPHTLVSFFNSDLARRKLELKVSPSVTIKTWPDSLEIRSWRWNQHMSEIIEIELGEKDKFDDNVKKLKLEGEEAIAMAEERIEEFLPNTIFLQES
jgi:hypothetical protein